jgi:hypothetical protein
MILVLNEWVFHDLLGENGPDAFRETAGFLLAFKSSEDKLVVPSEERWNGKAHQLMGMTDPLRRQVSQLFHSLLRDSARSIRVNTDEMTSEYRESYDWVPSEDTYLVLAYDSSGADALVTTDQGLAQAVDEHDGVNYRMRDDFLLKYMRGDAS